MPVDVETFVTSGLNFVKLSGSLTSGQSLSAAEARTKSIIESGAKKLVLDISAVTYADSSGLGALVQIYGIAQQAGCVLRLAGANEKLKTLLHVTRLDTIFSLDADAAASLAHLLSADSAASSAKQ
ncbi:MAG: STAS domain-containing protein [Acidobacteriales bacterium]|nr:STAS domain-containing protein [Terriglobales bacterium]